MEISYLLTDVINAALEKNGKARDEFDKLFSEFLEILDERAKNIFPKAGKPSLAAILEDKEEKQLAKICEYLSIQPDTFSYVYYYTFFSTVGKKGKEAPKAAMASFDKVFFGELLTLILQMLNEFSDMDEINEELSSLYKK